MSRGTGFLVMDRLVLTALNVVAVREDNARPKGDRLELHLGRRIVLAKLTAHFDVVLDFAVLEAETAIAWPP